MSGHNPGPWTHIQRPNGLVHIVTADLDTTIAIVPRAGDFTNAHLMAAAPELLAALEDLRGDKGWEECDDDSCALCAARHRATAAIKSARGLEDS